VDYKTIDKKYLTMYNIKMIKIFLKSLTCIVKDHSFIDVGKCPFTGNNYKMCTRCQEMVAV
jgi:hypothetical protein